MVGATVTHPVGLVVFHETHVCSTYSTVRATIVFLIGCNEADSDASAERSADIV